MRLCGKKIIMKKLLLIFLLTTQFFLAQSSFEKGNSLYQKGKYEQAISEYEKVLATKKHSAGLYYNLGNCYYKLNKVAPAIYNYEKALVLNPDDIEIKNNLKFAQKLQIDEIKVVPQVGFARMVHDFTSIFHYNTWAWISVGLSSLFLLFFLGYYFSETTLSKRIFFFGMFLLLLLMVVAVSTAMFDKNHFDREKPAVVFAEIVLLKTEPQRASTTIFTLHEGTQVFVLESLDNWRKIQLTDGTEGWIDKSAIKEVK